MRKQLTATGLAVTLTFGLALSGCGQEEGPAERMGRALDESVEGASETARDTAEAARKGAADVAAGAARTAEEAAAEARKAAEEARKAAEETVEEYE